MSGFLRLRRAARPLASLGAIIMICLSWADADARSTPTIANDAMYASPGRLVDVGGFRLNIYCLGNGSPTVVMDAGSNSWSSAFAAIQAPIATMTRVCTYDRAGLGFSDPGPMPRSSARVIADLHRLLRGAGVAPPYVLVGHSMGGYYVQRFAEQYRSDVVGMVLLDSIASDYAAILPQWLSLSSGDIKTLNDCSNDASSGKFKKNPAALRSCVQNNISMAWPDLCTIGNHCEVQYSARLEQALTLQGEQAKVYQSMLSEYQTENVETGRVWQEPPHRLGSLPLTVLTSAYHFSPGQHPPALVAAFECTWQLQQAQLLRLSARSKHIVATKSGHWIQMAQPELAIKAIEDTVKASRGD